MSEETPIFREKEVLLSSKLNQAFESKANKGHTHSHNDLVDRNKPNAHDASAISRGAVAVDSIADLLSLPEGQRREDLRYLVKGYYAGSDAGGGVFYWDQSRSSENNGGTVIDGFVRIGCSVPIEAFGCVGDGTTDNGDKIEKLNGFLVNSPIKVTAGKGVFVTSVPFEPTFGFSGSGINETIIKWIGNGINATGVVIPSGPGLYCDFTADGGVSDDPIAWDSSNYDSFTGSRGVFLRSGSVELVNVRGQNTRMAGIANYGHDNVRLENCETIRSRGNFGDGFYFDNCRQITFINCYAKDFTRIGFVAEGGGSSGPFARSDLFTYENCIAENGHNRSYLHGGGEFNAGFWAENSSNMTYDSCVARNTGERGFTFYTASGSSENTAGFVLNACRVEVDNPTHESSRIHIGYRMSSGIGDSINLHGSDYVLNSCVVKGALTSGYSAYDFARATLNNCSYINDGGGDNTIALSVGGMGTLVVNSFYEAWTNKPEGYYTDVNYAASISTFNPSKIFKRLEVNGYTTHDGEPIAIKYGGQDTFSVNGGGDVTIRNTDFYVKTRFQFNNARIDNCRIYNVPPQTIEGASTWFFGKSTNISNCIFYFSPLANNSLAFDLGRNQQVENFIISNCKFVISDDFLLYFRFRDVDVPAYLNNCQFYKDFTQTRNINVMGIGDNTGRKVLHFNNCTFHNLGDGSDFPIINENSDYRINKVIFSNCWKDESIIELVNRPALLNPDSTVYTL